MSAPCSVVELVFRKGSWVPARQHLTVSARSLVTGSGSAVDSSLPATPRTPRAALPLRLYSGRLASLALPSGRQLSLELPGPGAFSARLPPTPARAHSGLRQASFTLSPSPERTSMESASEDAGSRSPRLGRVTESPFE